MYHASDGCSKRKADRWIRQTGRLNKKTAIGPKRNSSFKIPYVLFVI